MGELSDKSAATPRRLAEAIRTAKIAAADRGDVIVDMKDADRARLELLAQELKPVFDDVPLDDPQWDFALSSGLQPRLWLDATAHVMMARDRRTYRFVRDTRLGRIVVAESVEIGKIAEAVTLYIAERLVERARLMEGEVISLRETAPEPSFAAKENPQAAETGNEKPRSASSGFRWFLLGAIAACIVLFALFHERLEAYLFQ
ncbi:hypothetical protein DKP76_13860 [Falsochrobactrum shanghaiense]|uniref:Uncharacterized protein n=1 Tax=Falsochrobactrum shanghaiense TaxID=2201899 RepID=A0A316J712_9HYPH|nr:hypothetical protein [Falsochrobactrum shanghaiense]PWL17111.1 hypothetical protein DKP76_13860 [Falsochrobactrum shanghaiense]